MLTGDVKKELIGILQKIISEHQEKRKTVTDAQVHEYMKVRPLKYTTPKNQFEGKEQPATEQKQE